MPDKQKPSFFIIGGGRAGASLAYYFARRGYPVLSLVERNPDRYNFLKQELAWSFLANQIHYDVLAKSDILLLTIRDDQIQEIASELAATANQWREKIVAHTSGAAPSSVLWPLRARGAFVASLHPVYSFATDPRENHRMNEIWLNAEGDDAALEVFEDIFRYTQNRVIRVSEEQKKAIHLACVFYANFYVALADISREILSDTLNLEHDVFSMLNPLLSSSIEQVHESGTRQALTGPIKRADIKTISTHLEFLQSKHPDLLDAYITLSRRLLTMADLVEKDKKRLNQLFDK